MSELWGFKDNKTKLKLTKGDTNLIALRDFGKIYKGSSLWCKIKNLPYYLRLAWDRAWKGYDFNDICNMDDNFIEKMRVLLPEFKKNNVAVFGELSADETDSVIDKMIEHISRMDDDACFAEVGGICNESGEMLVEKIEEARKLLDKHKDEFFNLFKEYFWCLWF